MTSSLFVEICNEKFDLNINHFSFSSYSKISNMIELKLLSRFSNLKSASFGSTNLNDQGLSYIVENGSIENLDLQDTKISNGGIEHLTRLKNLKSLRLKENYQLTNDCIQYINKLESLEDL